MRKACFLIFILHLQAYSSSPSSKKDLEKDLKVENYEIPSTFYFNWVLIILNYFFPLLPIINTFKGNFHFSSLDGEVEREKKSFEKDKKITFKVL
jgi:hypothetical protein